MPSTLTDTIPTDTPSIRSILTDKTPTDIPSIPSILTDKTESHTSIKDNHGNRTDSKHTSSVPIPGRKLLDRNPEIRQTGIFRISNRHIKPGCASRNNSKRPTRILKK